jgi:hypothetical protein
MRDMTLPGGYRTVVIATAAVQFVLTAIALPLGELFSATPLLNIDAAHHWYQVHVAAELAAQGRLVGYDPTFAAGYLGGVPYNTSAKFPAAIAALGASPAVAFKLFSFIAAIVGPAAVPLAARCLGVGAGIGAIAAALGLILWWASPIHWYHTGGVVAWPLAVFIASWFAAGLIAYITGRAGTVMLMGMTLLGAIMLLVHPMFPVAVLPAFAAAAWVFRRDIRPGRLLIVALGVPAVCVAANLPWILAMTQASGMAGGQQPYQQVVDIHMIWRDMLGLPSQGRGSRFYGVLVFLSLWGVFAGRDRTHRLLASAFFLSGMATVVFADLGSVLKAAALLQPNRFSFQAYVLLLVPAALGIVAMARAVHATGALRAAALAGSALGALAILFYLNEVRRELSPGAAGHYGYAPPEVRGPGPMSAWALDQLLQETTPEARVMFELSHARVLDNAHMAGYLAVHSGREFIGGAYPYTHFANAWDDWLFGRKPDAMPVAEFHAYLQLYNVGWIMAHSEGLKRYLANVPDVTPISSKPPLALYRVGIDRTFFVEGSGRVTARAVNRIDLADLQGETVVLKYHYVAGLRTDPPAEIDGVKLLDDPEPFVRIRKPPAAVRLYRE